LFGGAAIIPTEPELRADINLFAEFLNSPVCGPSAVENDDISSREAQS
jgi:hypothetical protein